MYNRVVHMDNDPADLPDRFIRRARSARTHLERVGYRAVPRVTLPGRTSAGTRRRALAVRAAAPAHRTPRPSTASGAPPWGRGVRRRRRTRGHFRSGRTTSSIASRRTCTRGRSRSVGRASARGIGSRWFTRASPPRGATSAPQWRSGSYRPYTAGSHGGRPPETALSTARCRRRT